MLREIFGTDGRGKEVEIVTLTNNNGTEVKLSTLGATIAAFRYRDKTGGMRDIVLGFDTPEEYLTKGGCLGVTVGRCANRIANATCTINGIEYKLEANDQANNLHSGSNGSRNKVWEIEGMDESANSVKMKYFSADLDQGFPGNMTMKVTFSLNEEDALSITYEAVSDKDTVANFTNHSYFNLAGHDSGYIGEQKLKLYATAFTPVSSTFIPTGEIRPVEGTPFDFTDWKAIGKELHADDEQLNYTGGYDHNFVLENNGKLEMMAEAVCEETGIHMTAYTDCPGVQLYTGNFIGNITGKSGAAYADYHGFCLESQYYPDSINNPAFATPLLKANEVYTSTTVYKLSLDED